MSEQVHPLKGYKPSSVTPHARNHTHECEVRSLNPPPPESKDSLGRQRIRGSDPEVAAKIYRETHHLPEGWPVEVEIMERNPPTKDASASPFKITKIVRVDKVSTVISVLENGRLKRIADPNV